VNTLRCKLRRCCAGKKIEARFDPLDLTHVEIYCDGKPEGVARLVDAVVNGRTYR